MIVFFTRPRLAGRFFTAFALAAASFSILRAETATDAEAEAPVVLDPVVVTATRTPTTAEKTAASVTVIDRRDIEEAQLTSATEALKTVPGLNIADRGMPGQPVSVLMRGTESRHTLILLDGHRLPTAASRYFDLTYFPVSNLDRIEVVRGPIGSAQGGGAVGGAINFISRTGRTEAPSVRAAAEYGSFNTQRFDVGGTGEKNGLYASVSGGYFSTDNERPNSEFESASTLNTVGWQISPQARLELLTGYQHRDGGTPGTGTLITAADTNESSEQDLGFVSPAIILTPTEAWTHTVTYSYAKQKSSVTNSSFSDGDVQVDTQGLVYQADFKATDWLALQGGVERNWQTVDSRPAAGSFTLPLERNEINNAGFAGVTVEPVKDLTLVGSVRRDVYEEFYGSANTWRYGFSYRFRPTRTVIHASDGTAFAAPEVQNFIDYGFGPSATSLTPERSRGQEVGVTQELGDKWVVGATAFRSEITDLVQFVGFTAQNVGEASVSGVETHASYRVNKAWAFNANYTYLSAKNEQTDQPLVRRPRHTVGGDVRVTILPGWLVGAGVRGAVHRYDGFPSAVVEDYVVARFFTQYALNKRLLLKLRVENALDEEYAEVSGYPALPVAVHGGVEWRF